MQKSRLFQILYYLLEKKSATAPELAEYLEVSVRTIYRDIDMLSSAGIPVYTEAGRNGGIRLMNDFVLDKTLLSNQEKQDILSAIQNLSIANANYAGDILKKLSALFQLPSQDWYEIDFSRWGDKPRDNEKFELLKYGIINHTVIKIVYINSSCAREERCIQPLKLLYKAKEWYLKAFCLKRQDFRTFKLNRILCYELLDETFTPVPYPEKFAQEESCSMIQLRFSKESAYRIYDEFDESQIELQEDGSFLAHANMPQDEWLTGYLLSFGTHVEVIAPSSLRDMLLKEVTKIAEYYKNSKP